MMKTVRNLQVSIHFVGISGSGMSSLAKIASELGCRVSGSDQAPLPVGLCSDSIRFYRGHAASNIPLDCELVVYSAAIRADNPELERAAELGISAIRRGEFLAQLLRMHTSIAVAGSHGKTSTTALISSMLFYADVDPTVSLGSSISWMGSNGRLGGSGVMVAETDESDQSFLLVEPDFAVLTNVDREHLGAYDSFEHLADCFELFLSRIPFYGRAVLCLDDPRVAALAPFHPRCLSYSLVNQEADVFARDVAFQPDGMTFQALYRGELFGDFKIGLLGEQMVQNSLAAIAIGVEFGLTAQQIQRGLANCCGLGRRCELLHSGEDRLGVRVLSDYAHHPLEIRVTLRALKGWIEASGGRGRLHCVFQPHRFSRVRDCFEDFSQAFESADAVYLLDIYAAGECPLPGISQVVLADKISHESLSVVKEQEDLDDLLRPKLEVNDLVVVMGAGTVDAIARQWVAQGDLGSGRAA